MPGLIRGVARTAAVAGTATAVSGRVQRRQAEKFASRDASTQVQRDQAYQQQAPGPAPAPAPAPVAAAAVAAAPATSTLDQLQQLGELKAQGILTDAEFEAQKAKILAS